MKKIVIVISAILICMALSTGCGRNQNVKSTQTTDSTTVVDSTAGLQVDTTATE